MQNTSEYRREIFLGGKKITVCPCAEENRPVIYLNTFSDEGERALELLRDRGLLNFTLVTVGDLEWDCDMSPWDIPPAAKDGAPCTGGAEEYLKLLENEIVPKAEETLNGVLWRGIAGYSLAGLFAVYALYKTDIFKRAASMSGSLWFPNFKEFVLADKMKAVPEKVYFSLGDRECRTKNPYFRSVRDDTEAIEEFYRRKGVETVFVLNSGGHNSDVAERTSAGIRWLLEK